MTAPDVDALAAALTRVGMEADTGEEAPYAEAIIAALAAQGWRVVEHACDLPPDHEGECWYESGTEDD